MTDLTLAAIRGRWELMAWEQCVGKTLIRPLGQRPSDPLGGTGQERAAAYATCLAYCGTYEIRDGHIVHSVQLSTFPNWTGEVQVRSAELHGNRLVVLRAAPAETPDGTFDAELRWTRPR